MVAAEAAGERDSPRLLLFLDFFGIFVRSNWSHIHTGERKQEMAQDNWPPVLFEKSQFPLSDGQFFNLETLVSLVNCWITSKRMVVLIGYKEEDSVKSALKNLVEKAGYQAEVANAPGNSLCPDRWMIVLKKRE